MKNYTDKQRAAWLKMHQYLMTIPEALRAKVVLELKRRQKVDQVNSALREKQKSKVPLQ